MLGKGKKTYYVGMNPKYFLCLPLGIVLERNRNLTLTSGGHWAGLPKLILYFSTEHPWRKVARPGAIKILAKRGWRGLTYAKIITNKRSCGAPAIIGSLFVARFLKNIVDRRIKIKPCMYVSL